MLKERFISVDGNWGEWGEWSTCTKTCRQGKQSRTRECNSPASQHGGKKCEGEPKDSRVCNEKVPCPGNKQSGSTINRPFSKMAAENSNTLKLETFTRTRKSTFPAKFQHPRCNSWKNVCWKLKTLQTFVWLGVYEHCKPWTLQRFSDFVWWLSKECSWYRKKNIRAFLPLRVKSISRDEL